MRRDIRAKATSPLQGVSPLRIPSSSDLCAARTLPVLMEGMSGEHSGPRITSRASRLRYAKKLNCERRLSRRFCPPPIADGGNSDLRKLCDCSAFMAEADTNRVFVRQI